MVFYMVGDFVGFWIPPGALKNKKPPPTSGGRLVLPTGELLLPALASHIRGFCLTSMAPWRSTARLPCPI